MYMRFRSFGYKEHSKNQNKCLDNNWNINVKRWHIISEFTIKCKHCGHTIIPTKDRGICSYCGYWVYKNDKIEFRYKTLERIKKGE